MSAESNLAVELNGWAFDGFTVDADGIMYSCSSLEGWWETASMTLQTAPRGADDGVVIVDERLNERPLALAGFIHRAQRETPVGVQGLDALRRLKAACRPLRSLSLLQVAEATAAVPILQSYVRLAAPMNVDMKWHDNALVTVEFMIPLIAQDPRRYDADLSSQVSGAGTDTITTNGDELTPPVFTITGPATDPLVRSHSVATNPILKWEGSVPGGQDLVIDCAEKTVKLNGVNARDGLTFPNWFQLIAGNNSIEFDQSTTTTWRDAYS
jgi:hypothetical protein